MCAYDLLLKFVFVFTFGDGASVVLVRKAFFILQAVIQFRK